jgi:PmbA protein
MIGREKVFRILARALTALEKAGAKAGHARFYGGSSRLTRFANNHIHQHVAENDAGLLLTAVMGLRLGAAGTNRLDRSGIALAAEQAAAIAGLAAEDPEFPGLADPAAAPAAAEVSGAYDRGTAALSPSASARLVAKATRYAAAKHAVASGKVACGAAELAVANSLGVRQYAAASSFSAACTAMIEGAAGSEEWSAGSVSQLEARLADFGREAVDTALAGRKPRKEEPGEWTVILAPRAVSTLIGFLAYLGFDSLAHLEKRSFLAGRMGTKVASEKVTIIDDGLSPAAMPLPFDFDGVPRRRLTLIENGVARELPHSLRTAKKADAKCTGHSFGPQAAGVIPIHVAMQPGDATLAQMVASTERGLLVNRFWYSNVAEPSRAVITGMTRDGLFLVEKGRLAGPVCNMRFTESIINALSRVEMVGSELQSVGDEWGSGVTRVPALKLSSFRFTGVTEF